MEQLSIELYDIDLISPRGLRRVQPARLAS